MDQLLSCSLLFLSGLLYEPSTGTTAKGGNHIMETPTTFATDMTNSSAQNTTGTILPNVSTTLVFSTQDTTSTVTMPGNTRDIKSTSQWDIFTRDQRSTQATTSTSDNPNSEPATTGNSTTLLTSPGTEEVATTSSPTGSSLVMLAFGVMSFILILIVVMVILVTAVNLRGRCCGQKEEGKKSCDSLVPESNLTSGEKESITLVSVKSINTETETDSPQSSSIYNTSLDNEDKHSARTC
ncbi:endothelial cell-specific chemotaxis regulator isoform X1 [Arapaima gigas]